MEADVTETLSLRKSYTGRRKILGEPAKEESTKNLTVRWKQGEKEVGGRTTGSTETSSLSHPPEPAYHHEC